MSSDVPILPLLLSNDDSLLAAKSIVEYFSYCAALPSPLQLVYSMAMDECAIPTEDPIRTAGICIAVDIDSSKGVGDENAYHNSQHLCEVLLCTVAIGRTAALPKRELALVHLAALIHDFRHDGQSNGSPFRLEKLAITSAAPYFDNACMAKDERQIISALVLATEYDEGAAYARKCFEYHFECGPEPAAIASQDELLLLKKYPKISLQALTLIEADILPSTGLTIGHASAVSDRLEKEWSIELSPQSKAGFIDLAIKNLKVSQFYLKNMQFIRDHYLPSDASNFK